MRKGVKWDKNPHKKDVRNTIQKINQSLTI